MARKSAPSTNPIRQIRLRYGKTLVEFSVECGVHLQAVYLNEFGMYPTVLPTIMDRLVRFYECNKTETEEEYQTYIRQRRDNFGRQHQPYSLPQSDLRTSPIIQLRTSLGYSSAFGFAKAISLNPQSLRRVEKGRVLIFPGSVASAFSDILLPVADIEELQYRHQEFVDARLRLRV